MGSCGVMSMSVSEMSPDWLTLDERVPGDDHILVDDFHHCVDLL